MRIDEAALEVLREENRLFVWYGHPELCQDIYTRSGLTTAKHPLNQIRSVTAALARSPLWERVGYIEHLGREHPVYSPRKKKKK